MKKPLRFRVAATVAAAAALVFSSCAYDPYYASPGGYYSSGYGDGYGYGGSHFTTSVFVTTGDPRWGYDPYCHAYYDYRTRRYYDPYLYGYYPIGYRPPVLIGVPHPHGWHPGRGYIRPPHRIRNVTVVNYRNREAAYRSSDYSWARQVRQRQISRDRESYRTPERSRSIRRPDADSGSSYYRDSGYRSPDSRYSQQSPDRSRTRSDAERNQPIYRERRTDSPRYDYNRQVTTPAPQQTQSRERRSRESYQQQRSTPRSYQREDRQSPPSKQRGRSRSTEEETQPTQQETRKIRGLGDG